MGDNRDRFYGYLQAHTGPVKSLAAVGRDQVLSGGLWVLACDALVPQPIARRTRGGCRRSRKRKRSKLVVDASAAANDEGDDEKGGQPSMEARSHDRTAPW